MEEAEGRCCAVLGCTNSGGGLSEWRAAECERHRPLLRADCPCLEPFCFYGFPSGAEERGHWLQALRGRGLELEPGAGAGAAVCSLHLEEGTLLLGLGLCKKPAAGQVAPPPASPTTTTVETRSSRARKRRHPGPRPWLHQEPAAAAAATPAPPRSWEQAAVQAIMRLRCASSQRVARALIACLKGENDHLRQRSRQLEAALGTTARQLERLQRECRCRGRPSPEARAPHEAGESPELVPSSEVTVG